ncbi:MAG TPA: serine hydrolase domain-containing protein [Chitinophagaceae bacterium]
MLYKTCLLILLFLLYLHTSGQKVKTSGPETINRSSANLKLDETVDEYIKAEMQKKKIPGLQIVVIQKGKIMKAKSYGVANVELNAPVNNETMFEIASNTKQFTAGGIMLLVEDGRLRLEDKITKYLPGLPELYNAITVRNLLNHTSGVKDYIEEFSLNRRADYTNAELIKHIGANQLNFPPGENARYSTTGYLLLGLIIEEITGKPYGDFLQERIFKPLGMTRTRVINLAEIIPNRASGYSLKNDTLRNGRYVAQTLRAGADIGLMTTAIDMAKWDACFNTTKIFKQSTVNAMFTPARLNDGTYAYHEWIAPFGFGWFIDDYFGQKNINHGGTFITGFSSEISRYVDDGMTIIILNNRVQSDPYVMGMTIAGMYDPDLRIPHQLKPKRDINTQRSGKLKEFLLSVAGSSIDSTQMTEGLFNRWTHEYYVYSNPKSEITDMVKDLKSFTFIACKDVQNKKIEKVGINVKSLCSYKIVAGAKTHFVTFYLTAEDKIADVWSYSHSE